MSKEIAVDPRECAARAFVVAIAITRCVLGDRWARARCAIRGDVQTAPGSWLPPPEVLR